MNGLFRPQGMAWPTRRRGWLPALACACILLMSLASAACGSATSAKSVSPGFAGYDWQVVAISHDGVNTSIPARLQVALQFSRGGRFGGNDSVNTFSGTYRATDGGFTASDLSATAVGYAGHDPAVLLAVRAIASFGNGVRATVKLTADRLVVGVGSYTLTCLRRGFAPTPPSPVPVG
jgi:heat shock protein HslJ